MTCEKESYRDKKNALRVLRRMQRNVRNAPLPVRVYFCPSHKAYHITSKPKRKNGD